MTARAVLALLVAIGALFWAPVAQASIPYIYSPAALQAEAAAGSTAAMTTLGGLYTTREIAWGHLFTWPLLATDDREAARWYRMAADRGDAAAMAMLGEFYAEGRGVGRDLAEAARWRARVETAANPGDWTRLGDIYAEGFGPNQDKVRARAWWTKAAEAGDTDAMVRLGVSGTGGLFDYEPDPVLRASGLVWAHKAADLGRIDAMAMLARRSEGGEWRIDGSGPGKDLEAARNWYSLAAEKGGAQQWMDLAYFLQRRGEHARAVDWLLKAAAAGDDQAGEKLAVAYALGQGAPQSDAEALRWQMALDTPPREAMWRLAANLRGPESLRWLRMSADAGDPWAQYRLGEAYLTGKDGDGRPALARDPAKALQLFQASAAAGEAEAMGMLAQIYGRGLGDLKPNPDLAVRWRDRMAKATPGGSVWADIGGDYYTGGMGFHGSWRGAQVVKDDAKAARLFRRAAAEGDENVLPLLAEMYAEGRGVRKSQAQAFRFYLRAAEFFPQVWGRLGVLYEAGRGVKKDLGEAVRWYSAAAEEGDAASVRRLLALNDNGQSPAAQAAVDRWRRYLATRPSQAG